MACARAITLFALTLLPAVPLTTAAAAPGTEYRRPAPSPGHKCGAQGTYAPGSAYEANLRLLAAAIPAEANASGCRCSPGNHAGERPDNVAASAYCYWRPDAGWPSDCAACIARAFEEAQRLCPYHRQAMVVVDGGECSVSFHDVQQREQSMGLGSAGESVAADGDHASYLDLLQYMNKELARYMSEDELMEFKNFTERATQASKSPECLTMQRIYL
ncbi:hypothetical protein SETIT_2G340900v2 [Setaria italica]|uniref:Gnk2-homologous domain-containing protein n=1 Tax=Setaria italica TaxID=4555 RepID=K3ZWU3_SETIT|nr:cysteine-rich receptor-like protein kinase 6 [Setaria italica]RCV13371.1 hypothetical protein SETIT_2G340900v2 [Setaria italica]